MQIDAAALDVARLGFHRAFPARSAKRRLHVTQVLWLGAVVAGLAWLGRSDPTRALDVVHVSAFALFAAMILVRLLAAAHLAAPLTRLATPGLWPVYTILCPLYREANVVTDLILALERLDYPHEALDIKLLVEGDDEETVAATLAAARAPHMEVVIVPASAPRTKPKALNVGLARARGDYVVVYDAEDRPHPQQLRAALAAFEDGDDTLACVQAPLAIDNAGASWLARQYAAEYAIQFFAVLPFLARHRLPLPLGGTSNHFRTQKLREAGGWDPYNVTEDADIGYRLARNRQQIGVIAPPTWEEAPVGLGAWLNQRSRWIKGHLQTWLVLMRNPFRTIHEMGLTGFLAMQLMLGGGLLAAAVHGPLAFVVLIAALTPFDLLAPADFTLALFGYCVAVFAALTASALSRTWSHAWAALTMPLYWPLATLAAAKAAFELIFRPFWWSKTSHGVSDRPPIFDPAPAKRHVSTAQIAARGRA